MQTESFSLSDVSPEVGIEPSGGPICLGSEEHKILFCRMLLTTHDPYMAESIVWPKLDSDTLGRLRSLPIWDIAVQTEGKAGLRVANYGEHVTDHLLKRALVLNALEERRHKSVLHGLVDAYGIVLSKESKYAKPRNGEWAFMVTGYSECIDSFFAFGFFEMARRSGYFPPKLVDVFEVVMREEGRHILFFVNWVAWRRRNISRFHRVWFALKITAVWVFLIWERLGIAKSMGAGHDNNFTMTGSKTIAAGTSITEFMNVCLSENEHRLSIYDKRLVRPEALPRLIRFVRRFMRCSKCDRP